MLETARYFLGKKLRLWIRTGLECSNLGVMIWLSGSMLFPSNDPENIDSLCSLSNFLAASPCAVTAHDWHHHHCESKRAWSIQTPGFPKKWSPQQVWYWSKYINRTPGKEKGQIRQIDNGNMVKSFLADPENLLKFGNWNETRKKKLSVDVCPYGSVNFYCIVDPQGKNFPGIGKFSKPSNSSPGSKSFVQKNWRTTLYEFVPPQNMDRIRGLSHVAWTGKKLRSK